MDNELKVKITGDVSDLKTALGEGEKGIDSFGKSTKKAEKETDSLKGGTEKLGKQLKNLTGEAQSAEGAIGDMAEGLGEGGLIGIGTAIIGTLGLLIAKVKSVQQEFGALAEAQSKAVGSAQAEIATLQALIGVANDETRSRQERERALGQINAQYGDYLGNLSLEELATEKVIKQVNLLTESLVRQAKIKGAQDLIAKESAELFEILAKGPIGAADNIDILQAALASAGNATSFTTNLVKQGLSTQGKAVEEADKKIKAYQETLNALLGEDIAAGGLSTKEGDAATKKASEKAAKDLIKTYEREIDAFQKRQKELKLFEVSDKGLKDLEKQIEDFQNSVRPGMGDLIDGPLQESVSKVKPILTDLQKDFQDMLEGLKNEVSTADFDIISSFSFEELTEFENKLKTTQSAVDAFSAGAAAGIGELGNSIAEGLKTDNAVVDAFAASIIKTGETLLQELISQAIAGLIAKKAVTTAGIVVDQAKSTSSAVVAASETASTAGPAAAFVLPVLIGAAIGFIAATFAGLKFASGGIVPGGSFNGDGIPALLNSGEMVLNARQQSNLFSMLNKSGVQSSMDRGAVEVIGVIRGQDILLSTKRAERNNNRFS